MNWCQTKHAWIWTHTESESEKKECGNGSDSDSNALSYVTTIPWSIAWFLNWNHIHIHSNFDCKPYNGMYVLYKQRSQDFPFHFGAQCVCVGVYLFIQFWNIEIFFLVLFARHSIPKHSSSQQQKGRNVCCTVCMHTTEYTRNWAQHKWVLNSAENLFCKWYHRKFVFDDGIDFSIRFSLSFFLLFVLFFPNPYLVHSIHSFFYRCKISAYMMVICVECWSHSWTLCGLRHFFILAQSHHDRTSIIAAEKSTNNEISERA